MIDAGISGRVTTSLQFPGDIPFGEVTQPNVITIDGIRRIAHWIFVGNHEFECDRESPEWRPYTHIQIGTGGGGYEQSLKPVLPTRSSLFTFFDERLALGQVVGTSVRHSAQFPIPIDCAVNEVGVFNGSYRAYLEDESGAIPQPDMLSQATFIDTVRRVRERVEYLSRYGVSAPPPGTDTIYLNVTWNITFGRATANNMEFTMEQKKP